MNNTQSRNIIGIFYLSASVMLGLQIILFGETKILPISEHDAECAFQIIIPTFLVQLVFIFSWYRSPYSRKELSLPVWVVVGPPICVFLILTITILVIAIDAGQSLKSGSIFKNSIVFSTSILGVTTSILATRLFDAK